jgi:predicted nucleic acid-binding protein
VLRAGYGFGQEQIQASFLAFLGIPTLHTDAPDRVSQALDWYAAGLDFADALHLAFSRSAEQFATFDDKLVKRANRIDGVTVVAP